VNPAEGCDEFAAEDTFLLCAGGDGDVGDLLRNGDGGGGSLCAAEAAEERTPVEYMPPVSVLKPLHGTEPDLEENLRRFFALDYPEYELLFCARHADDAGLQMAQRIAAEHPGVRARS